MEFRIHNFPPELNIKLFNISAKEKKGKKDLVMEVLQEFVEKYEQNEKKGK